jgi:hypothetical protein
LQAACWSFLLRKSQEELTTWTVVFALRHDRRMQTAPQLVGKFVQVGVTVNLDGHLGRIAYDVAVVAPLKMVFQFRLGLGIHRLIKVIS